MQVSFSEALNCQKESFVTNYGEEAEQKKKKVFFSVGTA